MTEAARQMTSEICLWCTNSQKRKFPRHNDPLLSECQSMKSECQFMESYNGFMD